MKPLHPSDESGNTSRLAKTQSGLKEITKQFFFVALPGLWKAWLNSRRSWQVTDRISLIRNSCAGRREREIPAYKPEISGSDALSLMRTAPGCCCWHAPVLLRVLAARHTSLTLKT